MGERTAIGVMEIEPGDIVIHWPPRGLEYRAEVAERRGIELESRRFLLKPLELAFTSGRGGSYRARWVSARSVRFVSRPNEGVKDG